MATWSGSDVVDTSMSMSGLFVLRNMSASEMQLMVVGWSEGRIPVVERMESPFSFFLLFLDKSSSLLAESIVLSFDERQSMMEEIVLLVTMNDAVD